MLLCSSFACCQHKRHTQQQTMACVYKNPNEAIEVRVKDLLSRMTLREKIGQMTQIERTVANDYAIRDLSIGTL